MVALFLLEESPVRNSEDDQDGLKVFLTEKTVSKTDAQISNGLCVKR
jgi:hypothetical protein